MNTHVMVARKQRQLTQKQLAKKVGVNPLGIVLIERHDWTPPVKVRQRIAAVLKTAETTLFGAGA